MTHSGHLIKTAPLPFSLTSRARYNSRKKISAATLHSCLPFEQTASIKFEKDTGFNTLSLNDICCYKKNHSKYQRVKISHLDNMLNNPKPQIQKVGASKGSSVDSLGENGRTHVGGTQKQITLVQLPFELVPLCARTFQEPEIEH